ncbi:MAG: SixA phosphatase family protein [Chloroflexota bacterium]
MIVYVVRHAPAGLHDAARWPDDSRRPLTRQGERKFARAAAGLGQLTPPPDVVLASPYARAWRTAELLAKHAGWPAPLECAALAGNQSADAALPVLAERADAEAVALVGHEPNVSGLLSRLLAGDSDRVSAPFKKGGVARLIVPAGFKPGSAQLEWFVTPGQLRRLAR